MELEELYQELILDHSKRPRCLGILKDADSKSRLLNPLCGDEVEVSVVVRDGIVEDVAFSGQGCAISQASASMMCEICQGKPIEDVKELFNHFMGMMKGSDGDQEPEESLGDAAALKGVQKFSARIKCATLAWEAIHKCLGDLSER